MAIDIKINLSMGLGLFLIRFDKSTDMTLCTYLLVFIRYDHSDLFREWFLFCFPIETITKATNFLKKIASFFKTENFLRNDLSVCCTDKIQDLILKYILNVDL